MGLNKDQLMINTVYQLNSNLTPETAEKLVNKLGDDKIDIRFDIAEGLYWYCLDYHSGQGSEEYRIQCSLGFRPGLLSNSPETEESKYIYKLLQVR